jgi:hypothetical protein
MTVRLKKLTIVTGGYRAGIVFHDIPISCLLAHSLTYKHEEVVRMGFRTNSYLKPLVGNVHFFGARS